MGKIDLKSQYEKPAPPPPSLGRHEGQGGCNQRVL